ncbi:hypothetical protein CPAV1605_360 [seawater metagenome]|uniref:Uncharacterized protein n=1 Tax=seawater metagenome TaxID=1561972 RepID=A0A5E8CL61_9ZZZZ
MLYPAIFVAPFIKFKPYISRYLNQLSIKNIKNKQL